MAQNNSSMLRDPLLPNESSLNHHPGDHRNSNSESILFNKLRKSSLFGASLLKNKEKEEHGGHQVITDLAMYIDDLSDFEKSNDIADQIKSFNSWDMWFLLILLAIIVPVISISFAYCSGKFLEHVMLYFIKKNDFNNFIYCLIVSITFAFTGCTLCYYCRDAEGSGIPELKSTLAGISIYKYLSFTTLIIKILGLFFAVGSGLFVGREGPFVHISAAVANNLATFPIFKRLHVKNTFRKQILATAGGIGITATFGTPVGGCLYSIETMATFFAVSAFWKSFFCSFLCGIVYHVYGDAINLSGWTLTEFNINTYRAGRIHIELFAFIVLGVICGIIGALHVKYIEFLLVCRKMIKTNNLISRYFYTGFTCFLTIFIIYYFWELGFMTEEATEHLFNSDYGDIVNFDVFWKMFILLFLKLLCNGFGVTCPLPTGIFVPMFLSGAILGRLYGMVMYNVFEITDIGRFSVVGAGALVSGVTHTLAMSVITLEVTGQMNLLFPMLVGVITSYYVSKYFTLSIYYVIVELKDLPYLPKLLKPELYNKKAVDIMDVDFPFLTKQNNMEDIGLVLSHVNFRITAVPILEEDSLELIGSVQTANLQEYLVKECKKYKRAPGSMSVYGRSLLMKSKIDNNFMNKIFDLKRLPSIPPNYAEYLQHDIKELNEIPVGDEFWSRKIDLNNSNLGVENSPFAVSDSISVVRLHFLFSMLGLHHVFVVNKGRLVGMISKESFQQMK